VDFLAEGDVIENINAVGPFGIRGSDFDDTLTATGAIGNPILGGAGNDTLHGLDISQALGGLLDNRLFGDASSLSDKAQGGDDTMTGGNNSNNSQSLLENHLFGDASSLSGKAQGGDDHLIGGDNSALLGDVVNFLFGDAGTMVDKAKGGNDVLIAGTANGGLVTNNMWGDAETMSGAAKGGADTFVFQDDGAATVGTENTIHDFSQSQHDIIQFIGVAGVSGFDDIADQISYDTSAGTATIHAGADVVTLENFTGTLTAHDFFFA
jgi:hypothetical protein